MTDGGAPRLRIGISACLLGVAVRYDGGHRLEPALRDVAGAVDWVPVCPEDGAGLGTPRPPMRLERRDDELRVVEIARRIDHTDTLATWAARELDRLDALGIRGYVFKSGSPSCGLATPIADPAGAAAAPATTRGVFAAAVVARFPGLPVSEAEPLRDARALAAFVARVRAYRR